MRIVVLPPRGVRFPSDSPWHSLLNGLRASGHEVADFGQFDGAPDALVTLNHQPEAVRLQEKFSIPPERSVLVALEPRVTAPTMYHSRTLRRYGHRFAASVMWASKLGAEPFDWPQRIIPTSRTPFETEFAATLINAEKRSAMPGALYGLRRKVIAEFDRVGIPLGVFGSGWEKTRSVRASEGGKAAARAVLGATRPQIGEAFGDLSMRPDCYQGIIPDKSSAFSRAPVTIVIENSADYVSEKLIDAVCAGVLPVYVGPPLELFGYPPNLAVCSAPDASQVRRLVQALPYTRVSEVIAEGRAWVDSKAAKNFSDHYVLTALAGKINQPFHQGYSN